MIGIDESTDPRLSDYFNLTDVVRRSKHEPKLGIYIAESEMVIRTAVAAGHRVKSMLMADRWLADLEDVIVTANAGEHGSIPVYLAKAPVLESVTGFNVHRGALAAMYRPKLPTLEHLLDESCAAGSQSRIAILDGLVNHTNVGAIFRSVAALGAHAVLVSPTCADPLYRRSIRVSMGTVFQVPWTRFDSWPAGVAGLRSHGFHLAALAPSDRAVDIDQFAQTAPDRLAVILGTEGVGLSQEALAATDFLVSIPMRAGVDSLNVAAASAVAFWALRR